MIIRYPRLEDWVRQRELINQLKVLFEKSHPFDSTTTNYVWGKEVRIPYITNEGEEKEYKGLLENWYMIHILDDEPLSYHAPKIIRECRRYELDKVFRTHFRSPLICQLCEWQPLETENGKIIRHDVIENKYTITMVKYCHIVDTSQFGEEWGNKVYEKR